MASTTQGARLTEAHRQAQLRVRAGFLAEFVQLWTLLNWNRLDDTSPAWVRAVMALIRAWRQASADVALNYYREYRLVEVPSVALAKPMPIPTFVGGVVSDAERAADRAATRELRKAITGTDHRRDDDRDRRRDRSRTVRLGEERAVRLGRDTKPRIDWGDADRAAERSLLVTGPSELMRRAGRGETETNASKAALVTSSGASSRQVLGGGRQTLLTVVQADDVALGWARVTDSDPCAFCALLASRGPVYKSRTTAAFQPHDGCGCTPEPVFDRAAAWPGRAWEFRRLYYQYARGHSGKAAVRAFRREWERAQRETVEQRESA